MVLRLSSCSAKNVNKVFPHKELKHNLTRREIINVSLTNLLSDLLFVVCIFLYKPLVVSLEILNADFELLVNPQPGIVDFSQSGRLFGKILPTNQTVGYDQFVQIKTDGLFIGLLKVWPFGQISDGIHFHHSSGRHVSRIVCQSYCNKSYNVCEQRVRHCTRMETRKICVRRLLASTSR